VVEGVDFCNSGKVDRILVEPINELLSEGMVPILPCIGWSAAGKPYNLPSDEIALAACQALGATKFFIVSADAGIRAERHRLPDTIQAVEGGRVARLTPAEAEEILELNPPQPDNSGVPDDEKRGAVRAVAELAVAVRASRAGVERVHLVDGREEGVLLRELFSNLGVGTMIYADEYESIRPMKSKMPWGSYG
jgi:amino-acid N-acetyltransferase